MCREARGRRLGHFSALALRPLSGLISPSAQRLRPGLSLWVVPPPFLFYRLARCATLLFAGWVMVWLIFPSLVVNGLMRPCGALPSVPLGLSAVVCLAGVSLRPWGAQRIASLLRLSRGPPPRFAFGVGPPPLPLIPRSLSLAPFATLRAPLRYGRAVASSGLLAAKPASAFAFRPARSLRSLLRSAARFRPFFLGWRGARFVWSSVSPRPAATLRPPSPRSTSAGAPRCDHPRGV